MEPPAEPIVTAATVSLYAPIAKVPPDTVKALVSARTLLAPSVSVPPETVVVPV